VSFDLLAWVADALVALALVVMTIGVVGLRRMPDVFTQLHATSKAVFLGVVAILVASTASGEPAIVSRAVLIGAFLLLTTPISAHVVARAAYRLREPMRTPGAVDESGRGLAGGATGDPDGEREDGDSALHTIVVGYDGSEEARRALERVAMLAGDDTAVAVVTAGSLLPAAPRGAGSADDDERVERRRVLDEALELLAELGVEAEPVEAIGDAADALVDTARDIGADLVVIGRRGRTGAARVLLGSVSTTVVNRAHCDVLVVR
jgi:multicomponent Na+:H+ antiporter subunit G